MDNKLRVDYLMLDLINRPDEYIIKVMIAFGVLAYITVTNLNLIYSYLF